MQNQESCILYIRGATTNYLKLEKALDKAIHFQHIHIYNYVRNCIFAYHAK